MRGAAKSPLSVSYVRLISLFTELSGTVADRESNEVRLVGVGRVPTAQSILLQENVTAATSEAPMRMTGSVKSRTGCEVCPAEAGQRADSPAPSRRARRFGRRGSARTVLAAQLSADGERCVLLTS